MIGWPQGRGITTITFSMAYVAVIIQPRLSSMDESIEEAALDLGARPAKVFFVITLPIIAPAPVSGWLLALTMPAETGMTVCSSRCVITLSCADDSPRLLN